MGRDLNHAFASLATDPMEATRSTSGLTKSSVRYEIVSTLRKQVFWRNALGLTVTEAPTPGTGREEGFYVNVEYEFDQGVLIDLREFIGSLKLPDASPVKKEIFQRLEHLNQQPGWTARARGFKYTVGITREQLDAANGVVYLRDLDLVVGYEEFREDALHPYSQEVLLERMREQINFNQVGNHHRLIWVDNTHQHDSMWYNNGLGVFEIRPQPAPQMEDGFYLYTQTGKNAQEKVLHLTFAEAVKEYLLYETRADAAVHGKPDKAFDAKIKEAERQLVLEKAAFNSHKQQLDYDKLDLDRQRDEHTRLVKDEDARRVTRQAEYEDQVRRQKEDYERSMYLLKMERERMDFERSAWGDRMKFDYDMDSRQRKDTSEGFKHALDIAKMTLGIISVGLSIYAVYQKAKKD